MFVSCEYPVGYVVVRKETSNLSVCTLCMCVVLMYVRAVCMVCVVSM